MRAYMESIFYFLYLTAVIAIGVFIIVKSKDRARVFIIYGLLCVLLGLGDAFHLIPRAVGLFSGTLDDPSATLAMWLGAGKFVTSITMTIFYVLLFFFIQKFLGLKENRILEGIMCALFVARVVLCAMPQNNWFTNDSPLIWGIIRNIPFAIMGAMMVAYAFIYFKDVKRFRLLWLAIALSFAFYIPVVLLAGEYPLVGMLMIPKTICYLWMAIMVLVSVVKNDAALLKVPAPCEEEKPAKKTEE